MRQNILLAYAVLILEASRGVDGRGIQQTGHNIDDVAGDADVDQGRQTVYAGKGAEGEQDGVHQLRHQRRPVVADPEAFFRVAEELGRVFPDGVIRKDVEDLYDAVDTDADQHEPGRIGKHRSDGGHGPVVCVGFIEEPGLAD